MEPNLRVAAMVRKLRNDRQLTLRAAGARIPISATHLSDIEHGRKRPSPEVLQRLDDVLHAGGALTALAADSAALFRSRWQPQANACTKADAEAIADALVNETPTAENAMRLVHEWMVAEPPQVYEVRAGRRVDTATAERIEQRVHKLRQLDDHIGGRDSYAVVRAELTATAALVREASYSAATGRRLFAAVGELAQLAGWVASDAGLTIQAEQLYLAGARAAHTGGDIAGAANNLSSLAYQIANVGDPHEAALMARSASVGVGQAATPTARALLAEREAWAYARAGQSRACDRALGEAEAAFERGPADDDPAWVYWLDEAEVEIMAGRCWTQLHRPLRAVPILRRATAGYGDGQPRETALYVSWLAEALLDSHEVEDAAQSALRALHLARHAHSSRASSRIDALHMRLHDHPAAVEFDDAYHDTAVS